ncbi:MAG: endo alpha-1,4 polygalactosaminidase [Deltaproteobacteria bacterium]|nr:endo alpha-1,4 polygalactosaminidase [Deltaproteobacteria bacterium]
MMRELTLLLALTFVCSCAGQLEANLPFSEDTSSSGDARFSTDDMNSSTDDVGAFDTDAGVSPAADARVSPVADAPVPVVDTAVSADMSLAKDTQIPPTMGSLASDGFENGKWEGWYTGEGWEWHLWAHAGAVKVTDTDAPHRGNRHVEFSSGEIPGVIFRKIYLVGATEVRLRFWYKSSGVGADDLLQISIRDDTDHAVDTIVKEITGEQPGYRQVDIDLSAYGMVRDFQIWFRSKIGSTNARFFVDDVEVMGNRPARPPMTWWNPKPYDSWDWTITGSLNTSFDVTLYDIDGFENDKTVVDTLHAKGIKVACYLDVGTDEHWRPDHDEFPKEVLGGPINLPWNDQTWIDLRRMDLLIPIMLRRLDMCEDKGFDMTQFDDLQVWEEDNGIPGLSLQDSIDYTVILLDDSHNRNMGSAFENNISAVEALEPYSDWYIIEEAARYNEISYAQPYLDAGKAVFAMEYTDNSFGQSTSNYCAEYNSKGIRATRKHRFLYANTDRVDCAEGE